MHTIYRLHFIPEEGWLIEQNRLHKVRIARQVMRFTLVGRNTIQLGRWYSFYPPQNGLTIWEIGIPDDAAGGFFIKCKSDWRTDWSLHTWAGCF
jgi:hypothetical protein